MFVLQAFALQAYSYTSHFIHMVYELPKVDFDGSVILYIPKNLRYDYPSISTTEISLGVM